MNFSSFLCFLAERLHFVVFRDEHDPFYNRSLIDGKGAVTGVHSNALMNQDWEKDLMEAGTCTCST